MQPVTAPMQDMAAPVFEGLNKDIAAIKKYQDEQDKYAVSTAYNNAQQQIQQNFYGDNGVFTRKGANALGAAATDTTPATPDVNSQTSSMMSQIRDNAMKGLSTKQQQMLSVTLQEPTNTYTMAAAKYQQQQQQVAWKENYDSTNSTLSNGFSTNMLMSAQMPDADTKQQFQSAADQNIRDMAANITIYGKQIGLTDAEIKANIQKVTNNSLKDTALNLITDGNTDAAKDLVVYYRDKMDADTYSAIEAKLRPVLVRQDATSITQSLFNKHGIDDEKGAYDELTQLKGNSPDFNTYLSNFRQFYTDQQKFQKQSSDKNYENVFRQVLSAGSVAGMQSVLDNSTNLKPSQIVTIQNHINAVDTRNKRIAKGTATPIEKWADRYEISGLDKDTETMNEYYERLSGISDNGDKELTPAQQTKYNMASIRLNKYMAMRGQPQGQPEQPQQAANPDAEKYDRLFRAIKAKYPDALDSNIYAYMKYKLGG